MCKPAHSRKNEFEPLNSKIYISFLKSSITTALTSVDKSQFLLFTDDGSEKLGLEPKHFLHFLVN